MLKFRWKIVGLLSATMAVSGGIAVLVPIAITKHHQAIGAIEDFNFKTGLSLCQENEGDLHSQFIEFLNQLEGEFTDLLPKNYDISISEFPSFSEPRVLRLVGQNIYYAELPSNEKDKSKAYKSILSKQTAASVYSLLSNDIERARAIYEPGLDGTVYIFRTSRGSCAITWSPRLDTRAWQIKGMYTRLVELVKVGNTLPVQQKEAELVRLAEQLEWP